MMENETITNTDFSDIYIRPDKKAYIPDKKSSNALMEFHPEESRKPQE